ncbi:MAG: hypothetical protein EXR86_12010 [Gammaproteobacteria bacterium]|nr:hypothetical protein [Gammaproteobacteria bacterium]
MATFRISSSNVAGSLPSVVNDAATPFQQDSVNADTLSVDPGAFLITNGVFAGAFLENTGAWTVSVNGTVWGANGINLGLGNTGTSTITVGADGTVGTWDAGLNGIVVSSSAIIKNFGTILGATNNIDSGAGAGIHLGGGTHTVTNTGTIVGARYAIWDETAGSNDTVTNSGTITGAVALGGGINKLTNSGSVSGIFQNTSYWGGDGADTVVNSGTMTGGVVMYGGINKLTNSGSIGEDIFGFSYIDGSNADAVVNSGTLAGGLYLRNGGANKVTNSGSIGADDAGLSYDGGNKTEMVADNDGADNYKLGAGNDTYHATGAAADGNATTKIDIVDGGTGQDTYSTVAAIAKVSINLDTVSHTEDVIVGLGTLAGKTARGLWLVGATSWRQ